MEQAYMGAGVQVDKGENARLSSLIGAMAIADLVKTTLGPKGMDKILQKMDPNDQSISVTNDGATILKSVHLDNAAAKVLVDMAKTQDSQVGDGTTSVAVLCGELLRQAEDLLLNQRLHPQTICQGYRKATQIAQQTLQQCAIADVTRDDLIDIAQTTLSSKLLQVEKRQFATLAVDAVQRIQAEKGELPNLDHIQILLLPGGSLRDSYLEDGFLLSEKTVGVGQPRKLQNAKILIANTSMDTDKIKMYGSRVQVDSLTKVADIEKAEKLKMKRKVDKIINHGCNVFINRQLIYNYPESLFAANNIMSIEHADFEGVERLAAVTGGEVVSTFDHPEMVTLGECEVVEQILIGETSVLRFGGCKSGAACSIVLRGSSSHLLQEAERSMHDALCIVAATIQDPRRIYGGGCTEVLMAQAIDEAVPETPGKQALAMTAFAKALRTLPSIIADNGGYDAAELVTQLRAKLADKESDCSSWGLDMTNGSIGDMKELGVLESFQSKFRVLTSAGEAAEMLLRVDDIIKCAPRQREEMI